MELLSVDRIEKIISTFGQERGLRYLNDYLNRSLDEIKMEAEQEVARWAAKLYAESSEEDYPYSEPECDWDDLDQYLWNKYWDELRERLKNGSLPMDGFANSGSSEDFASQL